MRNMKMMFHNIDYKPDICAEMNLTIGYLAEKTEINIYKPIKDYTIAEIEEKMKKHFVPFNVMNLAPVITTLYKGYTPGYNDTFNCILDENESWHTEKIAVYVIGELRMIKENSDILFHSYLNGLDADYYISTNNRCSIYTETGIQIKKIDPKEEFKYLNIPPDKIKYFNITDEFDNKIEDARRMCEKRGKILNCTPGSVVSKYRMTDCMNARKKIGIE